MLGGQTKILQPGIAVINKHHLFLVAVDFNLGYLILQQQLVPDFIGNSFKLTIVKPVTCQGINHAEHIPILIIYKWSRHPFGKVFFNRFNFAPQIIKNRTHIFIALLEIGINDRDTGLGVTGNIIQFRHLLDNLLNFIGHKLFHTFGTGSGQVCRHNSGTDGEPGIFSFGKAEIGIYAKEYQKQDKKVGQTIVTDCKFSDIHD